MCYQPGHKRFIFGWQQSQHRDKTWTYMMHARIFPEKSGSGIITRASTDATKPDVFVPVVRVVVVAVGTPRVIPVVLPGAPADHLWSDPF